MVSSTATSERLSPSSLRKSNVAATGSGSERANFLQQVVAERAANAAVGHFDQLFVSPRQVRTAIADQVGVDVDLAHVVHNHRHLQAVTVVQHVVQQSCLSSPEEAGQDSDGEFSHRDQRACSVHGIPGGKDEPLEVPLIYVML
jgi:hypothetical protein